jgi:pyruvate dehydrogenase E2 component (dihydrolipoamide acetyltransferase)
MAAGVKREPITAMRRAIAHRTQQSKQEIPHFYAAVSVDMSAAVTLLSEAVEWAQKKEWPSPTITDLCLQAMAVTLGDFPDLNTRFEEEEILYYQEVNIGLVVGIEEGGMLVPIVHNADRPNLHTLATITRRLRGRAEKGILSESSLSGGSLSLSNLGMYGLESFSAVINPPQAGMLALGAVRELPVVHEGGITARPMMKATLSVDHRLVDGIVAAHYLATWKELLEEPSRLMPELPEELSL